MCGIPLQAGFNVMYRGWEKTYRSWGNSQPTGRHLELQVLQLFAHISYSILAERNHAT